MSRSQPPGLHDAGIAGDGDDAAIVVVDAQVVALHLDAGWRYHIRQRQQTCWHRARMRGGVATLAK